MVDPDVMVVDASVLAAATFGEARGEEAAALLRGRSLAAPGLLWYEMAEVARVKCAAHPPEATAILQQLGAAHGLSITLLTPDWAALTQIALETGLTAYDASYLVLARALDAPLATFDRRLADAARRPHHTSA